jgi:uncharacterized protein
VVEIDRAGLEVLDRAACLQLLADAERGRVAINVGALPIILPVRFALNVDRVVMSVSIGSALDRATDGTVVAFQAEGVEQWPEREWSVCAIGTAHHLEEGLDAVRTAAHRLRAWAPELPARLVAISTERLTGRRTLPAGGATIAC